MNLFSADELKTIERAVKQAEARTAGQIVVRVAARSALYRRARSRWVLMGWALFSALAIFYSMLGHWPMRPAEFLLIQMAGMSLGFLMGSLPTFRRWLLNPQQMAWHVHQRCLACFLELGLQKTRARTGVLVYLSMFERRVEVLADEGIHRVCPDGYWDKQVKDVIGGIKHGQACAALCQAITEIGGKLAEHFPPQAGTGNELPDTVHQDPIE